MVYVFLPHPPFADVRVLTSVERPLGVAGRHAATTVPATIVPDPQARVSARVQSVGTLRQSVALHEMRLAIRVRRTRGPLHIWPYDLPLPDHVRVYPLTDICGSLGEFLTELNEALDVIADLGNPTATCVPGNGDKSAIVEFDVDLSPFGKFGLYLDFEPCNDPNPSVEFGLAQSGSRTALLTLSYNQKKDVPIPGLAIPGIGGVYLSVELDGSLADSKLKMDLTVKSPVGQTQSVPLTGDGIEFAIDFKCAACPAVHKYASALPGALKGSIQDAANSMQCGVLYAIGGGAVVLLLCCLAGTCFALVRSNRKRRQNAQVAFGQVQAQQPFLAVGQVQAQQPYLGVGQVQAPQAVAVATPMA